MLQWHAGKGVMHKYICMQYEISMTVFCGQDSKSKKNTKMAAIQKQFIGVTKYLIRVTSTVFESKDDPTQMTKAVIYNYILYYIQKTIHSKHICKNVHS